MRGPSAIKVHRAEAPASTVLPTTASDFNIVQLAESFQIQAAPCRAGLVAEVRHFMERHGQDEAALDEAILFSYAAHTLTDYERVLAHCERAIGVSGPALTLKVNLCCRIIRHFDLRLHPLTAAFGSAYPGAAPAPGDNNKGGGDRDTPVPTTGIDPIAGPDLTDQLFDPGQSPERIGAITAWMLATGASDPLSIEWRGDNLRPPTVTVGQQRRCKPVPHGREQRRG